MLRESSRTECDPSLPISPWSRVFKSLHLRLLCSCWDLHNPFILWMLFQGLQLVWKGGLALRDVIWDPGALRTSFLILPRVHVPESITSSRVFRKEGVNDLT